MLIGEIAERAGVSTRMLRHYDSLGLVVPSARTPNGYRQYSEDDIERLFRVEGLRTLGLGLREIGDVLEDPAFDPAGMIDRLMASSRERLAREEMLLRRLQQVRGSEPEDWSEVLRIIALMRGLSAEDPADRQRLALARGAAGERSIGPLVDAALSETDLNVAGALDWALAQAGDAAVPFLAESLAGPSPTRTRRAVEALSKVGTPRARAALAAAIKHLDPQVRARAAAERASQGDHDTVPVLIDHVIEGTDDVSAADALAELASFHGLADCILDPVEAALNTAASPARQRLTQALGDVRGDRADLLLQDLAADADHRVALTAAYLLRQRHLGE
jgi:DNA-binding transcriptional MerR regulator